MPAATRTTIDQVASLCDKVTDMLRDGLNVTPRGSNVHCSVELADRHGYVRMLASGSPKTCASYLAGMADALDIVGR
jgi:hypothetical protein